MFRFTTSADRRLAAISKVVRVRVLGSKNRLKIALPRSSGTFFTSRSVTETNDRAVSRICSRISAGRPSMVSRCRSLPSGVSCGLALIGSAARGAMSRASGAPASSRRSSIDSSLRGRRLTAPTYCGQIGSWRPPRSTSAASADRGRPAVVEDLVHRGADGAPGVQHVVHQDDLRVLDREADIRRPHARGEPLLLVVVAVEGHVDDAQRQLQPERPVQALARPTRRRCGCPPAPCRARRPAGSARSALPAALQRQAASWQPAK